MKRARSRRSRGLGSPSSVHEAAARSYAFQLAKSAGKTLDALERGSCKFVDSALIKEAMLEGALRAHYSATDEDARGEGTELHDVAVTAEARARRARELYKDKCRPEQREIEPFAVYLQRQAILARSERPRIRPRGRR